ncbi:MAG: cell division protein SepF [Candidatus Nanopelagicales bacterium]
MAGAMRKMAVYLGLVEDDNDRQDGYYEEEEWEYDEPAPAPSRRTRSTERSEPRTVTVMDPNQPRRMYRDEPSNVSPIPGPTVRTVPSAPAPAPVDLNRITTIHPHTYNDARRIGEEFREGVPVIMNLTEMEDGDAKRIVDFAAGLVFGLRGTIERVTNKVFLLSPANVEVGAEARAQLAQTGFFNQS